MPASPFFTEDHHAFAQSVRAFVDREITPNVAAWEQAETLPRALHKQAAAVGLLGLGFPEHLGGVVGDTFYRIAATRELRARAAGACWRA